MECVINNDGKTIQNVRIECSFSAIRVVENHYGYSISYYWVEIKEFNKNSEIEKFIEDNYAEYLI